MRRRRSIRNSSPCLLICWAAICLAASQVWAVSPNIVISQAYGGGGNNGATYKNDFIELFNRGATAVNVNGWSVQYASATGSSWQVTALTDFTIQPGQYYLVQEAAGSGGSVNLPTPDAIGGISMSSTTGKVALVSSTAPLSGTCPAGGNIVDFLGFGSTANCSETSPTANLSNTTAAIRNGAGCTDTDNNNSDFAVNAPAPRNTATPLAPCGGPPIGSCCHTDQTCQEGVTQADCAAPSVWTEGGTCALNCTLGACCINAACTLTTQAGCAGTWNGAGTTCSPNPCAVPTGSCCHSDYTCEDGVTQANCAAPAVWTEGGSCAANCIAPTGACCVGGACTVTTQANCSGTWTLGGTCTPNPCSAPAGTVELLDYNVLNYNGADSCSTIREPAFRTILKAIDLESEADMICVEEIESDETGADNFRDHVLNHADGPGANPGGPYTLSFVNGVGSGGASPGGGDNAFFYRPAKVTLLQSQTIPTQPAGGIRDITCHKVRPAGYSSPDADLHIFIAHLSSGGGASQRAIEAQVLRDWMEANLPSGANIVFCGDFNLVTSSESAWTILTQDQGLNHGKLRDPANRVGNWTLSSFADIQSQCPEADQAGTCASGCGYAGGGMDNRYDFMMTSEPLHDGLQMEYLTGSYTTYGNDSQHYNKGINESPVIPQGQTIADALACASDHLPVYLELQMAGLAAAQIGSVAPVSFPTVLVGGSSQASIQVQNTAAPPAQDLLYSLTAPAGFTAPSGSFTEPAGGGASSHTLTMLSTTSGNKSGNLGIPNNSSNDPAKQVALSGTVMAHAVPSTAQLSRVLTASLGFGTHPQGGFADQPARVYNADLGTPPALVVPLKVSAATMLSNPSGRFAVVNFAVTGGIQVGGFADFPVRFTDAGAPPGTYSATLKFSTQDDSALPGAQNLDDVVFNISATVERLRGDFNANGVVDAADIDPFVNVLLDPGGATADGRWFADMNADGLDDGLDIALFVDALLP